MNSPVLLLLGTLIAFALYMAIGSPLVKRVLKIKAHEPFMIKLVTATIWPLSVLVLMRRRKKEGGEKCPWWCTQETVHYCRKLGNHCGEHCMCNCSKCYP